MGKETSIAWTDHTFNPWRGCTKVHAGCANCYAEKEAKRFPANRGIWGPTGTRVRAAAAMWAQPDKWNAEAQAAGERQRVFCASLADVFEKWDGPIHDHQRRILHRCSHCGSTWPAQTKPPCECGADHPVNWLTMNEMRRDLFELIDRTPWLDWLLVTKRPERIAEFWHPITRLNANGALVLDRVNLYRHNVWLLTSVSDDATALNMIPRLLKREDLAPVLGVSAEPLLGPIDWSPYLDRLSWVIFGGESGPNARPCDIVWIKDGVRQCKAADVASFVKQLGANVECIDIIDAMDYFPGDVRLSAAPFQRHYNARVHLKDAKGADLLEWPADLRVQEFPTLKGALTC